MTWKEKKLVTILTGVLAVLAIVLLLVLSSRYRENQKDTPASSAFIGVTEEGSGDYTSLTYFNGATTLSFHCQESGKWVWSHDETFPLEESHVISLLEALTTLSPQQTLETVESLENCGLTEPSATFTAKRGDGSSISLIFGNATTDGESYYALMNGAESPVYIFSGELMELMQLPIYDMYDLPQMPSLTEDRLQKITVQGAPAGEGETQLRQSVTAAHNGTSVTWDLEGHDVTSSARLQGLLEDLAALEIEKCVDYRPSAKALEICGFTAPAANLWANYTTDTDLTETIQITVGGLTLDGAARYVRLNGEKTIFRVATELLDPLMVIALSGVEE